MNHALLLASDLTGKARIRQAALQMFARRGFSRTSLRLIAQRARVSIALIGHHYGNKQALYASISSWVAQTLSDSASKELHAGMPIHQASAHLASGLCAALDADPDLAACARRELQDGGCHADSPSLTRALHTAIDDVLHEFCNRPAECPQDTHWWAAQVLYLSLGPFVFDATLALQKADVPSRWPDPNAGQAADLLDAWRQPSRRKTGSLTQ